MTHRSEVTLLSISMGTFCSDEVLLHLVDLRTIELKSFEIDLFIFIGSGVARWGGFSPKFRQFSGPKTWQKPRSSNIYIDRGD